jgi:hypothetical protein
VEVSNLSPNIYTMSENKQKTINMMSYDEIKVHIRNGNPLPQNLTKYGFLKLEDFPETEPEFWKKLHTQWHRKGVPYCTGTYSGYSLECQRITLLGMNSRPFCGKCAESIVSFMTGGSSLGTCRPVMRY